MLIIGENMNIRRFAKVEADKRYSSLSYIHAGGKIGVLVDAETDVATMKLLKRCLKNVAMQIAALNTEVCIY